MYVCVCMYIYIYIYIYIYNHLGDHRATGAPWSSAPSRAAARKTSFNFDNNHAYVIYIIYDIMYITCNTISNHVHGV